MNRVISSLLIGITVIMGASVPAEAGLNLTHSNGGCATSLGLTQANVCSNTIKIRNASKIGIWYDFGGQEDQYLKPGASTTWTLNSNVDSGRKVGFDRYTSKQGIQYHGIQVYPGKDYQFWLDGGTVRLSLD